MIELQRVLNLTEEVSKFLADYRGQQKLPPTATEIHGAKLLNQEKDGSILYCWDDVAEWSEGAVVTHFGLYDPASRVHKVIHTYNQRVHVVSCSVNAERTLMAFSVVSRDGNTNLLPDKRSGKEVYSAFLAEIKAQSTRVFSLNLERPTFLKVQFLYGDTPSDKETFLLVMLHRESIGLYRIPLARTGSHGLLLRGQPRTGQVAKKFVWCQWHAPTQQLFYIHHRRHGDGEKQAMLSCVQFYSNAQHDNMLDVPLNFPFGSGRTNYVHMPLHNGIPDTSVNACILTQGNGTFCVCYQHHVPAADRRPKSSPLPRTSPLHRTSPLQRASPYHPASPTGSDTDNTEINYYICLVHHAKTLHGCVSSIPATVVKKAVVHFSWQGDCVMVMLPGYFVHILNVGIEFEPCHHILLHHKTYGAHVTLAPPLDDQDTDADVQRRLPSAGPNLDSKAGSPSPIRSGREDTDHAEARGVSTPDSRDGNLPVLSLMSENLVFVPCCSVHSISRDPFTGYMLEQGSGSLWKVHVDLESLARTFTDCYIPTTRTALLHYAILRTRDFSLIRKLFLLLCNDITSPEVPCLMAEYLVGMTYAVMRRQVDREVLRLLPCTVTEAFRGQFDKTPDGERLARVSYSAIHSVNIGTKTAKERQQRRVNDDMWDTLRRHLRWMQIARSRRLAQDTVKAAYRQVLLDQEKKPQRDSSDDECFLTLPRMGKSRSDSQCGSISDHGCHAHKTDTVLGPPPPFLNGSLLTEHSEKLTALTREVVNKHLLMHLHKDSKVKASNVAKEFVSCQIQQSQLLCHLLWSLRICPPGLTSSGSSGSSQDCTAPTLLDPSSLDEYQLFQLMERYSLVLTDIAFPVPLGFPSYFAFLAFRCLDLRVFMQYVNNGVLQLTGDFMSQVLTDIPDTDSEYVRVKHYLISKLPQKSAEECYRQWGHSSCMAYTAHQQVGDVLTAHTRRSSTDLHGELSRTSSAVGRYNTTLDSITFQPLAAFLKHLATIEPEVRRAEGYSSERRERLDVAALEEVALHHTRTETDYNMGTVNF